MNDTPQVTRNYLAQLELALTGLPDAVARDIVDGAREELAGLDASAAAQRIEVLGDPAFIAAEAREATDAVVRSAHPAPAHPQPVHPGSAPHPGSASAASGAALGPLARESRGWVVFVSLLVALGGFVVPVVGWLVGIVLMWLSGAWRRWEKVLVTFGPGLVAVASGAVLVLIRSLDAPDAGNVLVPMGFDFGWSAIVLSGLLGTVFGIWALVRAYPRTASQ